jgi:hypothetical protein
MSEINGRVTELELMNRLGIESWRNLSKDKFMTFVSDLPNLDKDVALKIVAQFPDFKELVNDSFEKFKDDATEARAFNWKSQKKVHKAFSEYREILKLELERENLTSEDRFRIIDYLRAAVDAESAKDTENKKFQVATTTIITTAGLALVGAAVAVLGGNTQIGGGSRT